MTQELATIPQAALSRNVDSATFNALREIYDGASDEKLGLVLDYCKARKLDPLKKPVHIVPVWSARRKQMVETVWPSVAEVRITAMRTGLFAGQEATNFGPTIKGKVGNAVMEYPEWAQVTVHRLVQGQPRPFPGPTVRWLETYANKGKDDASPNAMWQKRPFGQLEKCAEAAALRRAFPEETGNDLTAEEMHGKTLGEEQIVNAETLPDRPPAPERAKTGIAAVKENAPRVVEVAAEPVLPVPAPEPSYQDMIDKLQDGEHIEVKGCKCESVEAKVSSGKPWVIAKIKSPFVATVFDETLVTLEDTVAIPGDAWAFAADGEINLKLVGRKNTKGEIKPIVLGVEVVS